MPQPLLNAYAEMRPRVEAERLLGLHSVLSAAGGRLKRNDEQRFMRQLKLDAAGGRRPRAKKATAADMEAMGIAVVRRGTRRNS